MTGNRRTWSACGDAEGEIDQRQLPPLRSGVTSALAVGDASPAWRNIRQATADLSTAVDAATSAQDYNAFLHDQQSGVDAADVPESGIGRDCVSRCPINEPMSRVAAPFQPAR